MISQRHFPLLGDKYDVTSKYDRRYNCIAWALGEIAQWWWPIRALGCYWPDDVPLEVTIDAFAKLFEFAGYTRCADETLEEGYEKIALFAISDKPTHAARQLPTGSWTSKLGKSVDIRHALRDLEGPLYGRIAQLFRRPINNTR